MPFGTGLPFCVTVAVMTDVELVSGDALETLNVMVAPAGGVVGVEGVTPLDGEVGDSPLHAAKISSSATTANKNLRCRMLVISTPVIPSPYAHPLHE